MTVTDIKEVTKSQVKIEIDRESSFVLYKGELRIYGIREGQDLTEENYNLIMKEVLPKRAKLRAMNLLKSRSYTSHQLLEKLTTGGYSKEHAKEALDYVASFGYVDDRQYARDFIEYNKEKKSRQRIASDLQKKGIAKPLFEEMWEDAIGEDMQQLEKEQIKGWLLKKHFDMEAASVSDIHKMTGFLYRKGFSFDAIRNVLSLDITSI